MGARQLTVPLISRSGHVSSSDFSMPRRMFFSCENSLVILRKWCYSPDIFKGWKLQKILLESLGKGTSSKPLVLGAMLVFGGV